MIFSVPLNGLTLMFLWAWFAVPLGVPGIVFFHACGIHCLVASFRSVLMTHEEVDVKQETLWGRLIARNLVCLSIGWVVAWWV